MLAHKIREAMAAQDKSAKVSGEVEIDGMYTGGYIKPRTTKRTGATAGSPNQNGKRSVVIVARERNGKTITFVTKSEDEALPTLKDRIELGSTVYADEAGHWDQLHARYVTKRINHREAYSANGACTNMAESLLLAPSSCGNRNASPRCGTVSRGLRRRNGLERRQSPREQWRAISRDHFGGCASSGVASVEGILAAPGGLN